jgi:hypothetical protein
MVVAMSMLKWLPNQVNTSKKLKLYPIYSPPERTDKVGNPAEKNKLAFF